jgi:hypothetical protein
MKTPAKEIIEQKIVLIAKKMAQEKIYQRQEEEYEKQREKYEV